MRIRATTANVRSLTLCLVIIDPCAVSPSKRANVRRLPKLFYLSDSLALDSCSSYQHMSLAFWLRPPPRPFLVEESDDADMLYLMRSHGGI